MQEMLEMQLQSLGGRDSQGGGNGNPLQYSCKDNPVNRGAWRAVVHEVAKSQTQLSDGAHTLQCLRSSLGTKLSQGLPTAPLKSQLLHKAGVSLPPLSGL